MEGLVLKDLDAPYVDDRVTKAWWSWKVDPLTVLAVLIYAERRQADSGGGYTDYTFAVWDEDNTLVPFTHAHQGLTDSEVKEIDRFVKQNTVERFGPVSSVKPELVFEIAFESIRVSSRHKSGIAVRSPRVRAWLRDNSPADADQTLEASDISHVVRDQDLVPGILVDGRGEYLSSRLCLQVLIQRGEGVERVCGRLSFDR